MYTFVHWLFRSHETRRQRILIVTKHPMDTYDDYCWFPEPSLSTGSAAKQFPISGGNAQHIGQPHRQPPSAAVYSNQQPIHHQQHPRGHHGDRHQRHQSPQVVVNSALSSPSSGYCSSEDCPGGFPPIFGGAIGLFSPRSSDGGACDTQPVDPTSHLLVDRRLLQSPASTLSSSSSSLVGSGATSPWQASSPGGVLTADPCLGPQTAFSIPMQQQQQQQRLHHSHFTASQTMHQEFVDDYGAAWSGAIGFDDLETLWDPFGATGCDRMAPIRYQRLADTALETVGTSSTAVCRGVDGVERMDSSSAGARDQNLFGQYHHNGLAFTQNISVGGEHSYVGIAASAIASQNGIGDRFATGSGNDDGSSVDYGFCMSTNGMATGVLGETSLIDMLQRDAYLSSASPSVGYGGGFGFGLGTSSASVPGDLDTSTGTFGRFQHTGADNMSFSSNQSSSAVQSFKATPSSALLHDSDVMVGGGLVAGYHLQHMAADMATGCDDTDDFDMFYRRVDTSGNKKRLASDNRSINAAESSTATWEGPSAAPSGVGGKAGSALFGGVFGHRQSVTPDTGKIAFNTAAAVGPNNRSRGLTVAKSCGSLLQMAPSYGSTGIAQATGSSNSGDSSAVLPTTRPNRPSGANGAARSNAIGCARLDVRGGRSSTANSGGISGSSSSSSLYPGLDDHRYTTKAMPTVQLHPPTKVQKTHRNGVKQSGSAGRLNHVGAPSSAGAGGNNNTSVLGSRSILEAFLRSTRTMDPNKGSNAALAADGLLHHLHIGDRSPRKNRSLRSTSSSDADDDDDQQSGTLLKKLLTGELDQSDLQRGRDRSSTARRLGGHGRRNHPAIEMSTRKQQTSPPPAPPPSREEVVDDSLASSSMPVDIGVDLSTVDVTDALNPVTALVNSRLGIGDDHDGLGIDMDLSLLDDPACMAIFGMINEEDADDYVWMSATAAAVAAGDCYDLSEKVLLILLLLLLRYYVLTVLSFTNAP